jgi:aspartate aminotransferase
VRDSEDFARWLLTDYARDGATVMLAPAQGFYATPGLGHNEVRIAYVLEQKHLEAAVGILADGLTAYRAARRLEALAVEQAGEEDQPDFNVPVEG